LYLAYQQASQLAGYLHQLALDVGLTGTIGAATIAGITALIGAGATAPLAAALFSLLEIGVAAAAYYIETLATYIDRTLALGSGDQRYGIALFNVGDTLVFVNRETGGMYAWTNLFSGLFLPGYFTPGKAYGDLNGSGWRNCAEFTSCPSNINLPMVGHNNNGPNSVFQRGNREGISVRSIAGALGG
jgi:hypothetical protein